MGMTTALTVPIVEEDIFWTAALRLSSKAQSLSFDVTKMKNNKPKTRRMTTPAIIIVLLDIARLLEGLDSGFFAEGFNPGALPNQGLAG
jgi:hypothetical protein